MPKVERKATQNKQDQVAKDNQPITDVEIQPRKPKDWEPPKTENEDVAKPELE